MSNNSLDRPTFEAIEAYVLDRMSAEERTAFEQRMDSDAALREEVELEQENIRAVELGGMQRVMEQVVKEEKEVGEEKEAREGGSSHWLKYAAAAAVLLIGAIWWLNRPDANERLFAEHFSPDPGLPVAMGATDDPAFADAMVSYKEGKYAEARAKWEPLLQREPTNDTLRYYIACSAMAMDDAAVAIPHLEALSSGSGSTYRVKAQWFLFLAYIKEGEMAKAKDLPLDDDVTYGERAKAIKAEL